MTSAGPHASSQLEFLGEADGISTLALGAPLPSPSTHHPSAVWAYLSLVCVPLLDQVLLHGPAPRTSVLQNCLDCLGFRGYTELYVFPFHAARLHTLHITTVVSSALYADGKKREACYGYASLSSKREL